MHWSSRSKPRFSVVQAAEGNTLEAAFLRRRIEQSSRSLGRGTVLQYKAVYWPADASRPLLPLGTFALSVSCLCKAVIARFVVDVRNKRENSRHAGTGAAGWNNFSMPLSC